MLSSTTSHLPRPPAMEESACQSPPGCITGKHRDVSIHLRFCVSPEILFSSLIHGPSVRTANPACPAGTRDRNHLVHRPFFTANPQTGAVLLGRNGFVDAEILTFYRGCYELLSHLRLATAHTSSFIPTPSQQTPFHVLTRFFPVLWGPYLRKSGA